MKRFLHKVFPFNPLRTNCVVLWREGEAACTVVDPGMSTPAEMDRLRRFLAKEGLSPETVLLTHGHFDHLWGVPSLLRAFPDARVFFHKGDLFLREAVPPAFPGFPLEEFPFTDLSGMDAVETPAATWRVLPTPGHTPGGVCFHCEAEGLLLTGDTLFAGTIGRTDLPGGDYDQLMASLQGELLGLPGETEVVPGHGFGTTLGAERATNPFLHPFEDMDEPGV